MMSRLMPLHAAVLSAIVMVSASNSYAFTAGTDNGGGSSAAMPDGGSSAEPSSPEESGRYNFSDRNFNVSVRRNAAAPDMVDEPESKEARRPSAPDSAKSPGFFDRIWNDLANLVGAGN